MLRCYNKNQSFVKFAETIYLRHSVSNQYSII